MKNAIRTTLLILISLGLAAAAQAELVDLGDVTQDTDTRLEWRDVGSQPLCTINQVLADDPACGASGWRYATAQEVCVLFGWHAVASAPCPMASEAVKFDDSSLALIQLLGITDSIDYGDGNLIVAMSGIFDGGGTWGVGKLTFDPRPGMSDPRSTGWVDAAGWFLGPDLTQSTVGHLLVRDMPEPVPGLGVVAQVALVLLLASQGKRATRSS